MVDPNDPLDPNMDDLGDLDLDGSDEAGTAPESAGSEVDDFYPEDKVPNDPQSQDAFRGMKQAYTRKTQEVAQLRKQYETGIAGFEEAQRHQQILQGLLQDPRIVEVVKVMAQEEAAQSGKLGSPQIQRKSQASEGGVSDHLQRTIDQMQGTINQLQARLAVQDLSSEFPGWKSREAEIASILRSNPGMTPRMAYLVDLGQRAEAAKAKKGPRRGAPLTEPPSASPGVYDKDDGKEYGNIRDAGIAAAKQLGIPL